MAATYYRCLEPDCKIVFEKYAHLVLHYGGKHKPTPAPSKEDCAVEGVPEGYEFRPGTKQHEDPPPAGAAPGGRSEAGPVYRGQEDVSGILRQILSSYPGIKDAVVNEIMDWERLKGVLHPMEVRQLLIAMADVPKGAADIIPQKYSLALQKAAQDGQVGVMSTLSYWGMAQPSTGGGLGGTPFPGFGGMPGGAGGGGGFGGYPNPNFGGLPFGNYPNWGGGRVDREPSEPRRDPETEKRFEAIEASMDTVGAAIQALTNKLTQDEEEKRQEAINKRLDGLATAVANMANARPRGDEENATLKALLDEVNATKGEISKIREETAKAQIDNLTKIVTDLSSQIKDRDRSRVEDLEEELKEARTHKPVTGRTEMDVVSDLATKALDTIKDAGKDVKSVVLAGQTEKRYDPQRIGVKERAAAGEKLAAAAEAEVDIAAAESAYLGDTAKPE